MKRLFKKFVTLALAAATLSSTAVFAQNETTNLAYVDVDVSDMLNPYYVYNEVINGKYTGKQVLVKVEDKDIKWVTNENCYEAVYPYAGYSVMYVTNPETKQLKQTNVTAYNNTTAQWQTKREDWIFEFNWPYTIVERQRTNTPFAGWKWDFGNAKFGIADELLYNKTGRNAKNIKNVFADYGFAYYDLDGSLLDPYKLLGDFHCDKCVDYTYHCDDCFANAPLEDYIEYWEKADAEKVALQLHFGVVEAAITGDGVVKAAFDPAAFLADVQFVRACNKHVKDCKSKACGEAVHVKDLTIANVLAEKYGILGWDEIVDYVLTEANLEARGTVAQNTKEYPRSVFGNLLNNEGANRYFLSDDIIAEIIPMIQYRTISGSFRENSEILTYNLADEYIKSEIAYETAKKGYEVTWPEYVYGSDAATREKVIAKRLEYFNALLDNDTKWEWKKYNYNTKDHKDEVLTVVTGATITWTAPNFELAPPHKYYQYMIVDGIVCDGTNNKPLVWRYTGANADPKVEWKLDSFTTVVPNDVKANTLGLYATIERLYVNGIKTDITRVPALAFRTVNVQLADWTIHNEAKLDYAFAYMAIGPDGKFTDYYITDNNGINILVYRQVNHGTIYGNNVNPNNDKLVGGNATFSAPTIAVAVAK